MFLRANKRIKDGKEHFYWNIVENRRTAEGRIVQRQVLYLGEINDSQKESWCRTIEVWQEGESQSRQVALFAENRTLPVTEVEKIQLRVWDLRLLRPRQWGACWLSCLLWDQLRLDGFWQERLPSSREGTRWMHVLKTLVVYRLLSPGSEWRLHRQWYESSALGDLLGEDFGLVAKDKLYRCLDKLVVHKRELFSHLGKRWEDLFQVGYEVILYDLTSTYFECEVPEEEGVRRFGYSRDHRSDCVQVVIALVVTVEGFPLAYEVMPGNTSDKTTLRGFLKKIEEQYGPARRVWVMDRGIPTEEVLEEMRHSNPPICYLVGTSRGKLSRLEQEFLQQPWEKARESVEGKLLNQEGEMYVLARSQGRVVKERSMRRRKLKQLWHRLQEIQGRHLRRDELLIKVGASKQKAGRAYTLVNIHLPHKNEEVSSATFSFTLNRDKLRQARRREGNSLLRTNLCQENPAFLWQYYLQLTQIEQAFKNLKSDLQVRPVYHQKDARIEAHIFVSFLAYCLQVTLQQRCKALAPGLTAREVMDKMAQIQMLDVPIPTSDGRELKMCRYTQPEKDQSILLDQLRLSLPDQPPPKIMKPSVELRKAKH